jgi:hypothetical protein
MRFLYEVPVYVRRMSFFDIVGVFSCAQIFTFIESLFLLGVFIAAAFILPNEILGEKFVAQGTITAVAIYIWGIPAYYQARILQWLSWELIAYVALFTLWIISFIAVVVGFSIWIRRNQQVKKTILTFVDKIILLSMVYLFIDGLAFLVVLYRNLI